MDVVVVAIGLFAVSEVLTLLGDTVRRENVVFQKAERIWVTFREFLARAESLKFRPSTADGSNQERCSRTRR